MPTEERSAGFIIYRVVPDRMRAEFLLLDYGQHWDFAKGHVEPGETDIQAARRELEEETGINDIHVIPGFAHEIEYFFRHKSRGLIRKRVIFFLALTRTDDVRLSEEHSGYALLPLDAALKKVTYKTARAVLAAADEYLKNLLKKAGGRV